MVGILVQLVVILLIAGLLWFAVTQIPGLPAWVRSVITVLAVLFVVVWLATHFLGSPGHFGRMCF